MIINTQGLGDISSDYTTLSLSDYLTAIFTDSAGNLNFAMIALVGIGGYLLYTNISKDIGGARAKYTKRQISKYQEEIDKLRHRGKGKVGKKKKKKEEEEEI